MRITPLDVRKQEFRRGMRGLDAEEVYAFLSTVADEYEAVLNDNKALRERLIELDDKVQEYRQMERTLRDTLLTAERVTVEAKDNARREANIIIKEAQMEAERSLANLKNEAMKLRQQIQQLRSQRESYLAKMRVVTESHLDFVESAQGDFQAEDRALSDLEVEPPRSPARRREPEAPARPTSMFDAPPESVHERSAGRTGDFEARPARPATDARPAPQEPAGAPPMPQSPEPPRTSERPGATLEPSPEPVRVPDSREPLASHTQGLEAINAIIDRMTEGQREILQSASRSLDEAGETDQRPQRPTAPTIEGTSSLGSPSPDSKSSEESVSSDRTATATAESPRRDDATGAGEADSNARGNDVTGEWDIDQIRRDILGRGSGGSGRR